MGLERPRILMVTVMMMVNDDYGSDNDYDDGGGDDDCDGNYNDKQRIPLAINSYIIIT